MDTVCSSSLVYGLDPESVLHFNDWRGWRVSGLKCFGAKSKSVRMKSSWDGFMTAKETLPG